MSDNQEEKELKRIMELQEAGFTEEQIEAKIQNGTLFDDSNVTTTYSQPEVKGTYNFDFSNMSQYDPFQQEPPKPEFFKEPKPVKHKQTFILPSDRKYTLNGQERMLKKMTVNDTIRLISKVPGWAKYLEFNVPEMLVDEFSGEYRVMDTLLKLFERAFSDYDYENERPTDFSLSVLDEVVLLLNHPREREKIDLEYLLDCDPEEVFDAVAKLIEYNKGFFTKAWSHAGPIRSLISLISGMISSKVNQLNAILNLNKLEMNQNPSEE